MLRIAVKEPMIHADEMASVIDVLFEGEHALLKDIRLSDLWAARLAKNMYCITTTLWEVISCIS